MSEPLGRWALTLGIACGSHACAWGADTVGLPLVQMNLSAAAFAPEVVPGNVNFAYMFPSADDLEQWRIRGIKVFRFPILWERLQPTLNGGFDPGYAQLIDAVLAQAAQKSLTMILDVHNYGAYRGQVLGSKAVPLSAYRNLLARMAARWQASPGLQGYDLMNEPNGVEADAVWPQAAQAGINGVRSVDVRHLIFVEGRQWSSALNWPDLNDPLLKLKDPANKLVFSAHLYLDDYSSGTYLQGPGAGFNTQVGVNRAKPFVEWLERNGQRGQIGEFGFPGNDPRWAQAGVLLLKYLKAHCVPLAYWAAGPMWAPGGTAVQPEKGVDKPQWKSIAPFVNSGGCKLTY